MKTKLYIPIFLLFLLFALCSEAYSNPNVTKVKVMTPVQKVFTKKLTLPAECKALNSKDFVAQSSGIVEYIADHKKSFSKGELILAIDKSLSESLGDKASSEFKAATLSFQRDKQLFSKKIISDEKLEHSKVEYFSAKTRFEETMKQLDSKLIYAPFNGEVSVIKYKLGDKVNQGDFLLNIVSGSEKFINFSIPASYRVSAQNSTIQAISNGNVYNGNKLNISSNLSEDKNGFPASFIVDSENKLEHNSFISVLLRYDAHNSIGIPESCIFINDGKHYIYVIDNNLKANKLEVKTGDRDDNYIEILSDQINEHTKIVSEGIQKLQDGQKVEIIE